MRLLDWLRRRRDERAALRNVEQAARELDALFAGEGPGAWTLDDQPIGDHPVAAALLSLHDYLNDVEAARAAFSTQQQGGEPC